MEASNGRQALELVDRTEIHLILMDIMMPGLDGIGATARLRESKNIPVILLTAKSEDTDKVLGLSIGAADSARVWAEGAVGAEGAVAVHIRHLREKLEINPSEPRYLKVVWGQGYKIERGDNR
jgi:DNA-binding response OmpR family regulator